MHCFLFNIVTIYFYFYKLSRGRKYWKLTLPSCIVCLDDPVECFMAAVITGVRVLQCTGNDKVQPPQSLMDTWM